MNAMKTYGLTHVALAVRDVDRSSAFYRSVFGAVEVYRQNGFVQLQTPGARDVIVLEQKTKGTGKSGGIAHFGFRPRNPKDIDAAARAVKKAWRGREGTGRVRAGRALSVRRGSGRLRDRDLARDSDESRSEMSWRRL
mgnify:CR=1 FL=1